MRSATLTALERECDDPTENMAVGTFRVEVALLGAVRLEEFALSVDPVARRLVPVEGYLMPALA
jgi:hypothetical protein